MYPRGGVHNGGKTGDRRRSRARRGRPAAIMTRGLERAQHTTRQSGDFPSRLSFAVRTQCLLYDINIYIYLLLLFVPRLLLCVQR